MIQVSILTENQAEILKGKEFAPYRYFNPIQDANGNWIIGDVEVNYCTNPEFQWVKDLPLINWNPPIYDDIY